MFLGLIPKSDAIRLALNAKTHTLKNIISRSKKGHRFGVSVIQIYFSVLIVMTRRRAMTSDGECGDDRIESTISQRIQHEPFCRRRSCCDAIAGEVPASHYWPILLFLYHMPSREKNGIDTMLSQPL